MVSFNVFCAGIFFSIFTDIAGLQWKNKGDVRWARRCDFPGNDIENVTTNGESCGPKCLENSYCTHFSWKHSNGGICWLKSGVANESSAKSVSTESAICGFVKPAGIVFVSPINE